MLDVKTCCFCIGIACFVEYLEYLSILYHRIPELVFEGGLAFLILGTVLILSFVGAVNGWRKVAVLFLIEYVFLIYSSTVIFRETNDSARIKTVSVAKYKKIIDGGIFNIEPEMLMNVLVFIPLGGFICLAFKGIKWWYALIICIGISVSIEVLQFVLKRGTTELADIFHNTLGCLIGIGICSLIRKGHEKFVTG